MDFSKSVGIGEVPKQAIDKIESWFNGIKKIEIITCWYDFNEVYCTVAITENGSFDMPVTRIIGVRVFSINTTWQISEDFNRVLK